MKKELILCLFLLLTILFINNLDHEVKSGEHETKNETNFLWYDYEYFYGQKLQVNGFDLKNGDTLIYQSGSFNALEHNEVKGNKKIHYNHEKKIAFFNG